MSYEQTAAEAKLAARDVLRTGQVQNRVEEISSLNASKKQLDEDIKSINKQSQIALVETNDLPDAHPLKAERVEAAEKLKEKNDERITRLEKEQEDLDKQVTTLQEEIASIEAGDGKIKVNREPLRALAKQFVEKHYEESFVNGDYAGKKDK